MTKKEQAYHDLGKFYTNFSIIFFFVGKVNCISMKENDADSDKYLATAFHSTISKDFKKIILTQIECRGIDTTDFISLCDEDLAFLVSARTDLAHGYFMFDDSTDQMAYSRGSRSKVIHGDSEWQKVKKMAEDRVPSFRKIYSYYIQGKTITDMMDTDGILLF